MAKFQPGNNANPNGKPKSAFKDDFELLQHKKRLHEQGLKIVGESWESIIRAMANQAVRGNVQAAVFLRDTFIGKPKEVISHTVADKGVNITLSYNNEKVEIPNDAKQEDIGA
jgi:hypothetical protein